MIRFGVPTFDRHGRKRGIVLLNYFGNHLLRKMHHLAGCASSQVMLLNPDGYWLRGPVKEDEWGFMYHDRKDRTFGNQYPDAWPRIRTSRAGQFYTRDGLFTFATIHYLARGV
jgi:hypothetical protein